MGKLSRIFDPITIGNVELKNRLIMLGMSTGLGENYRVNDRFRRFVGTAAEGGVGLIILGCCYPCDYEGTQPQYLPVPLGVGIWDNEFIPGLQTLAQAAHEGGAKIACQLSINYEWRPDKNAPLEAVGPSVGPGGPGVKQVRELTVDEIGQIVEHFGEGARRAREAGFDMIEFHAGIGYFINRFLSSYSNKRTDAYGGDIQKRARFLLEIIESARKKAGEDFPIICRIAAEEFMDGGNTLEDTAKLVPLLEKAGTAAFNVQVGWHESPKPLIQQWVPEGAFVYAAEAVKKVTGLPVAAAYRITDPITAEAIVSSGRADMVGMARGFLADPDLPQKSLSGQLDEVRHCIACCQCVETMMLSGSAVSCTVNAGLAEEPLKPAAVPKRVLVIGGGPAGMETARVAATRGHHVTLCEKSRRLGGLMTLGQILNDKLENLNRWMIRQVHNLPIDLKLKTEVTPDLIESLKPDIIVLAPGGKHIIPEIPGTSGRKVIAGSDIMKLIDGIPSKSGIEWKLRAFFFKRFADHPSLLRKTLGFPLPPLKKVVIIGGQFAGCELALTLMEKGKKVTILEESKRIGADIGPISRWIELDMLKKGGVDMHTRVKATGISDNGVHVTLENGEEEFFAADTVIMATGIGENTELSQKLEGLGPEIYLIGDATGQNAFTRIKGAIASGYEIGKSI